MPKDDSLRDLIERVEAGETGNALDVLIEVALFHPGEMWRSARPNDAGTKIVFTNVDGDSCTCWAGDWTERPETTLASLRAHMGTGG